MCKPIDTELAKQGSTMLEQKAGYQLLAEIFSTLSDTPSRGHGSLAPSSSLSRPLGGWLWEGSAPLEPQISLPPTSRRRVYSYDGGAAAQQQQRPRRLSETRRLSFTGSEEDTLLDLPCKPSTRRSLFSLRNLALLAAAGGISFLIYAGITALYGATPTDVREIDSIIQSFSETYSEREQDEELRDRRLKEIKASILAGDAPKHRILIVGMAESLQELHEHDPVVSALSTLCWVYSGDGKPDPHSGVDVRILYKGTKMEYSGSAAGADSNSNDMDDEERVLSLQGMMNEYGCRVVLEPEEILWRHMEGEERVKAMEEFEQLSRYKRLAKLRSFHRSHILSDPMSKNYDVVVNVDMDVVRLPPILAMLKSVDQMAVHAEAGTGSVVCANGFEIQEFPFDIKRQLYYDTLAAIDNDGVWAYHKMTTSIPGVIKFAQTTLLRDILRQKNDLWPMQSCFGGVAMYDFDTWATPDCDYDEGRIRFVPPFTGHNDSPTNSRPSRQLRAVEPTHAMAAQLYRERWTLDPKYTLSGTQGGDACEHVTFQKCLHDHSLTSGNKRSLKIGVQPDLFIEREAACLGRMEDVARVAYFLGKPALFLTLLALSLFPLIGYMKRRHCDSLSKQPPRIKKHVHEA